jgi:hypothetical protein
MGGRFIMEVNALLPWIPAFAGMTMVFYSIQLPSRERGAQVTRSFLHNLVRVSGNDE